MRYRPIIALEDEPVMHDDLQVTKAIADLEVSRSDTPEAVEVEIEEVEDAVDRSQADSSSPEDQVTNTEDGDQSTAKTNADGDDSFDEFPSLDDEDADLDVLNNAADAEALESIADSIYSNKQVELTPEQIETIGSINDRRNCECSLATESMASITTSIKNAAVKIWDYILGMVEKIVGVIEEAHAMNLSKLKIADEDLEKIYNNIAKIKTKVPKSDKITPNGLSVLASTDDPTPKELLSNVDVANKAIKAYFDHVKTNSGPFIASVMSLYNSDIRKLAKITESTTLFDEEVIDTEGTLHVSKDTVPSYLKRVIKMEGRKPPFTGAVPMQSERLPGGVKLVAWVCNDRDVSTAGPTDVLKSNMSMVRDNTYMLTDNDVTTPNPEELVQYMNALKSLRATLSIAEGISMSFIKQFGEIKKLSVKMRKEANAFEKMPGFTNLKHISAYKRRSANMMVSIVVLSKNFYSNPNQYMMFYGNRFMAAGISYMNTAVGQYVAQWKAEEAE